MGEVVMDDSFSMHDFERYLGRLNENETELACELRRRLSTKNGGCEVNFDSVLCWPQTPTNTVAILPCLSQLNGIQYDTTRK